MGNLRDRAYAEEARKHTLDRDASARARQAQADRLTTLLSTVLGITLDEPLAKSRVVIEGLLFTVGGDGSLNAALVLGGDEDKGTLRTASPILVTDIAHLAPLYRNGKAADDN